MVLPDPLLEKLVHLKQHYDVIIIGAGVLGTSTAYVLSQVFKGTIAVIDKEKIPALHTTTRNTGVIHRPFYLDPTKKEVFARSSQESYPMWKEISEKFSLPWNPAGTLEIATRDQDLNSIEKYSKWAEENGMKSSEIQIFNKEELEKYEPGVRGHGAILSKTDACVDFGQFTRKVMELAVENGVTFIPEVLIKNTLEDEQGALVEGLHQGRHVEIRSDLLINALNGDSLPIAHQLGLAKGYAVLHFRGDYWIVDEKFRLKVKHNIYTVPRHKKYPFLDPHFIRRHDGSTEVGPTASLVGSPYDYTDSPDHHSLIGKVFERPSLPKLKLALNPEFLNLVRTEWRSSRSKEAMAERVRNFLPGLADENLLEHGLSGVRNSLIDKSGFVPEAIIKNGEHSIHVLNYNSPGATGGPAFAMYLLNKASEDGFLTLQENRGKDLPWNEHMDKLL